MTEKSTIALLNLAEAAERVGCNPATLRVAAREGRLEAVKVSKTWLVTPMALETWKEQRWTGPRNRTKQVITP